MRHPDPDRGLVEAFQEGKLSAFEELFHKYRTSIFNLAMRICANASDAADITQEAFLTVFRKVQGFRFDSKFSSWLYRIVVNLSIDFRRKNAVRYAGDTETLDVLQVQGAREMIDEKAPRPEQVLGTNELQALVQKAILYLSPKFASILLLRYMEGLSYNELADVLRCSIGTVKSRLARAHRALELLVEPYVKGGGRNCLTRIESVKRPLAKQNLRLVERILAQRAERELSVIGLSPERHADAATEPLEAPGEDPAIEE